MKLAIDVYYYENKAKTVGILFKDCRRYEFTGN
ncbi:hypothetical protein SASC598O02_002970 [Snodgrassella alvi SCGC AB-598-O02]|nr:hypothetical protein SASC598O02_002970 [Snodgrassella alvi SCGC AB-598-O02]